ncbi:MAG: hypothetical protein KDD51_15090 [Bdellovibrionales bacterium]|nr:hypothetical protein [Bdellovibrionales bacterium]
MRGSTPFVWKSKGAILLETLWVLILAVSVAWFHTEVMIRWREKFDWLQQQRLRYDGKRYPDWVDSGNDR